MEKLIISVVTFITVFQISPTITQQQPCLASIQNNLNGWQPYDPNSIVKPIAILIPYHPRKAALVIDGTLLSSDGRPVPVNPSVLVTLDQKSSSRSSYPTKPQVSPYVQQSGQVIPYLQASQEVIPNFAAPQGINPYFPAAQEVISSFPGSQGVVANFPEVIPFAPQENFYTFQPEFMTSYPQPVVSYPGPPGACLF